VKSTVAEQHREFTLRLELARVLDANIALKDAAR
jgi:hypothetical protein